SASACSENSSTNRPRICAIVRSSSAMSVNSSLWSPFITCPMKRPRSPASRSVETVFEVCMDAMIGGQKIFASLRSLRVCARTARGRPRSAGPRHARALGARREARLPLLQPVVAQAVHPLRDRDGSDLVGGGAREREPADLLAHAHHLVEADAALVAHAVAAP